MPVEEKFSAAVQNDPGSHPASYTKNIGSLPQGAKRTGYVVVHPLLSNFEVKEIFMLYVYPLCAFMAGKGEFHRITGHEGPEGE